MLIFNKTRSPSKIENVVEMVMEVTTDPVLC